MARFDRVVCAFVLDEALLDGRYRSPARARFMLGCLEELDRDLRARGGGLVVRRGRPERELPSLAREGRHPRRRRRHAPGTQGWMPNRVRLVAGRDPAQNNGNWQWIAGVGSDPAPYFGRMYSPERHQERFDSAGDDVRRWIPELGTPD